MSAEALRETGTGRPLACPVSVVVLAAAGALAAACVHGAAPAPPAGTGADRIGSPEILLAAFDTLWMLLLLPGRRMWDRATLLAVGLPFHAALAAAASAGPGHAIAFGSVVASYTLALGVPGPRGRFPGLALALVTCAAPLVGYALLELAAVDASALIRCSPLTVPTLLARSAPDVAVLSAGMPAVAGAAVVLGLDQLLGRLPGRRAP